MRHGYIDDLYAEYLKGQIGGGCPVRAKRALQEVCALYSRNLHFQPLICAAIEVATVGQLEANRLEPKVRRWCLNVLALIGTADRSRAAIERVIELYHNDPDTMASALTAFFKVEQNAYANLRARSYLSPEQIALAAHIGNFAPRLRTDRTTINIEIEGAPILRSALVAVGLQRAPEHLFHPHFENAELVRKLSQHDDADVMQYAVWAINEHPELGVEHLGFNIADIGVYVPNIRGWTYRLYGQANIDNGLRHEVIEEGSRDPDIGARLNLARGLRNTWYDGLEAVTCPWFYDETDADIREEILDHMVCQSGECSDYLRLSLESFEGVSQASHLPQRMLASAKGKAIYVEMRKLQFQADGDLFGNFGMNSGGKVNVTNNYNINNIQGGAVSIGGNAEQIGNARNNLSGNQMVQLKADLQSLANELRALPCQTDALRDVTALVDAAVQTPGESSLAKVRKALGSLMSGTASLAKFGGDATKIVETVEKVMSLLPSN